MSTTTFDAGFDKALETAKAEQSEKDQAPKEPVEKAEAAPTVEPTKVEEKEPEAAQPDDSSDELLPKEEVEKLRSDPEAFKKYESMNKAFTQKTQALAEQRKAVERYQALIESFEADPQTTVKALAKQYGVTIQEEVSKPEVKQAADDVAADLAKELGPDLDFLAPRLGPAIERAVQKLAGKVVTEQVAPIKAKAEQIEAEAISHQVDADLESFGTKYPDWKKYEPQMSELGARFQPAADPVTGKYPTSSEYMEFLYFAAKKDDLIADATKKTIERMTESAKKSDAPESGTPAAKVSKAAPKGKNFNEAFDQAFKDAQAGVTYE